MAIRADAQGLRPVATVEAILPAHSSDDARREQLDRLLRIPIGQSLKAEVLSALKDGSFLVKIGDASARMALPTGAKAGDSVVLTLIAREPRPTFSLGHAVPDDAADLSNGGRLIDRLLQAFSQPGSKNLPPSEKPLLPYPTAAAAAVSDAAPAAAIDTPKLAAALRDAVASSGLFYESHLQQWAAGKFPVAEVMREPQAQIGRFFQPGIDATSGTDPRHQQMTAIVGAQFEALEQQRILWQGEAWPGLPMELRIEQDCSSQKHSQHGADAAPWQSEVRFELPELGEVTATIRLVGNGVQMTIRTQRQDAATLLRQHGPSLHQALDAAGSRLDSMQVSHGD